MSWMFWIGLALAIAVIAAVTGAKPRGSRPVAGTRLMGAGRVVLLIVAAIFVFIAFRSYGQ